MACRVERNNQGQIISVQTEDGQESQLFEAINSNIYFNSPEIALQIYSNAYSDEVKALYNSGSANTYPTGEPKIYFRDLKGNTLEDLEDIIIAGNEGRLDLGFVNPQDNSFLRVATFNTSLTPTNKFITSQIAKGVIEDKLTQGKMMGKGNYVRDKVLMARVFQDEASSVLGNYVMVEQDGSITIENPVSDYVSVYTRDGGIEVVSKTELKKVLERDDVLYKEDLYLRANDLLTRTFDQIRDNTNAPKNKLNTVKLINFLSSLGISITTMDNYRASFTVRHGQDTDVAGLIDLSNRVVALAEGVNIQDVITEEVAHLAVEAYNDQASIISAMMEVEDTQEYRDWAEVYRNKYSDEYSGIELENKVRKEILGKVLARSIQEDVFTSEVATLWQRFLDFISSRFTQRHKSVLNNLVNNIRKDILNENYTNFSESNLGDDVYFSLTVNDKIASDINKGFNELNKIQQTFKKHNAGDLIGTLERVEEDSSNLTKLENINSLNSTIKANLNILNKDNQTTTSNGIPTNGMSLMDYTIFEAYNTNIPQVLNELRRWAEQTEFNTTNEKKSADSVVRDINDILSRMGTMQIEMDESKAGVSDEVVNDLLDNSTMSEQEKQNTINNLDAVSKDVGFFHKLFSPLSQSASPFLGILGKFIQDMYTQTSSMFKNVVQGYTTSYEAQNWRRFEKSIIARDEKGNATYYFEDGVDRQLMEDNRLTNQLDILQRLRPQAKREDLEKEFNQHNVQEVLRNIDPEKTTEQIKSEVKSFQDQMQEWELENNTSRWKKEYYDDLRRLEQIANVSPDSLSDMSRFRRMRSEATSSGIVDGKLDMSRLSEREKAMLDEINRAEKVKKSPVDNSGGFYPGLRVAKWNELSSQEQESINRMQLATNGENFNPEDYTGVFTVLSEGSSLEDLSIDARFVLDSFNIGMARRMENKSKGISFEREASQEFRNRIDEIDATQGRQEAIKFYLDNSRITYSDNYYDSIDSGSPDYISLAQEEINQEQDELKRQKRQEALDRYKDITSQRREILKAYKDTKDSTEIKVEDLTAILRNRVIEIDQETTRLRRIINLKAELEFSSNTEKTLGASYESMRRESGKTSFDFALEHMTAENRVRTEGFKNYLERSRVSDVFSVPEFEDFLAEVFEEGLFSPDNITEDEGLQVLADLFAERNLASYMYSYKIPAERERLISDLTNWQGKLSEAPTSTENFQLNPNFQWTENDGNNALLDPEYNPKKGRTPRLSKYRNADYFSKYGITEQEWLESASPSELTARNNIEEFNLLQAVTNINQINNEKTNSADNIFLRPQISKTNLEKVKAALKLKGVKDNVVETVKEFFTDRIDVLEYGSQELAEIGAKLPPKMFRRKLEQASLLSEDTFSASMLLLKEAYLYENRMKTKHKVDALRNKLIGSTFQTGLTKGKITVKGQVSDTLKAYNEAADYHLYGVRQTLKLQVNMGGMEVDLTPFIIKMQRLSNISNLAFSPFIAATSLATGVYNNLENTIIGQHYDRDSVRKATGKVIADMGSFTAQGGKINNTSRISALMEKFGLTDTTDRLRNSVAGRAGRVALRSPFAMDRFANLPVVPQILYTILYDYRFVDGQYMSHPSFVTYQKTLNPQINQTEIKNKWSALQNDTFFDALEIDGGTVSVKESVREKLTEDRLEATMNEISSKAKNLAQAVDGQLSEADKLAANRNIILNLMMQHRGWLFINVARMFKGRHYNYQTAIEEEGTYYSAISFAKDVLLAKGNFVNAFGNLDELSKQNLKRVGLQMVMLNIVFYLALLMKGGDDDDDTFAEDFGRYITYRTYGETSAITPSGMFRSIQEAVKQPVVMTSLWTNIGKTIESTYNDKEDDVAPNLRKLVGAKSYDQIFEKGVDATTQDWLYFNQETMGRIYKEPKD